MAVFFRIKESITFDLVLENEKNTWEEHFKQIEWQEKRLRDVKVYSTSQHLSGKRRAFIQQIFTVCLYVPGPVSAPERKK